MLAVVAGGDDQRPEDEEGDHLEDRADVLGELDEGLGDLVLGGAHRDPGDEGGDQAVADRDVGEAEGEQGEADRVDALVARGQPAAGEVVVEAAADDADDDPDQARRTPPPRPAAPPRCRVAARRGEDEEEEDERQRQPVVEARLEVERVADAAPAPLAR